MSAVRSPMSAVVVEYDTTRGRRQKEFEDAYEARRFFTAKDKAGKSPAVKKPATAGKQAAIYVRVSSNQQETKSQEPDLRRWADAQEGSVVWYSDKATGKNMDRPGWSKLEQDIQKGKVGTVVVWRIDRLGRTARGLTTLFEWFAERKVNLVSLRDGLDLSTPAGRLMGNVLASVAQYETEIRGERVRAGQSVAMAKGKRWGGSKPGVRKRVSDIQIKAIHRMREEGETVTNIAKALGFSRPTIYDVLRSPGGAR